MRKKVKLSEIFKVHSEKSMLKHCVVLKKREGGKQGVKLSAYKKNLNT